MRKASILLFTFCLLFFVSCSDDNVYRDPKEEKPVNIWRVQDKYFPTMQEAADYIIAHQWTAVTKALGDDEIQEANTAHLLKNVLDQKTIDDKETDEDGNYYNPSDVYDESYRKGLAITDKTTTGTMKIDFGGFRYDFYYESTDKDSYFFKIDSGEKIDIENGMSVIFNEADHNPYAIRVDTKVVTIDAHLLDDRRRVPSDSTKSDSNLIYVGENGHLSIEDIQPADDQNPFEGRIAVVTDGTTGAILDISTSTITVDNIYTMYRNEDGTVSETIASGTAIPEEAKSHINIESGEVTILAINQQSDYYDKDTGTIFDKAVITFTGTKDDTTIITPHSIQETIDEAVEHSDGDAKHNIVHMMTYYPEVPATCTAEGHKQYWICTDPSSTVCAGRYYLDADGTTWTTDFAELVITALSHNFTIHVERKEATCTEEGNIEYWYCNRCGKNYSDNGTYSTNVVEDTVIPALGHDYSGAWVATDASYHWKVCTRCGAILDKAEHTFTDWVKDGDVFKRHCEVCLREEENSHAWHELVYHPAADPTCTESGNIEYWQCSICKKYYSDAEATNELSKDQVFLSALGHDIPANPVKSDYKYNDDTHWIECSRCHERFSENGHVFEILFDADISKRSLVISSYCNTCEKKYVNKSSSQTGAFDLSVSSGITVNRNVPYGNSWTISVNSDVAEKYKNCTCKWYAASNGKNVTIKGLEGPEPFSVTCTVDGDGTYLIYCKFTDADNTLKEVCTVQISR